MLLLLSLLPPAPHRDAPAPDEAGAAASVAATAGDAGKAPDADAADVHKMIGSSTSVCSYLWKRMLCRRFNCRSLHPKLCSEPRCIPNRAPNCTMFHGHYREERNRDNRDREDALKSKNAHMSKPHQGNLKRGALPPTPRPAPGPTTGTTPPHQPPPSGGALGRSPSGGCSSSRGRRRAWTSRGGS